MLALIIFLTGLFVVLATGALSAWSDVRSLTIPNQHSLVVAGAFFVTYGLLWVLGREDVFAPLTSHLLSAVIVFVVTLIMFSLKMIGAGDSKLASVFALWVGLRGLIPFLFYMTLMGAILGLSALALRKWKPVKAPVEGGWVARVQAGESKVPYGVAIFVGVLASFLIIGYFSTEVLGSFVL